MRRAIDLRTVDRHPLASVGTLTHRRAPRLRGRSGANAPSEKELGSRDEHRLLCRCIETPEDLVLTLAQPLRGGEAGACWSGPQPPPRPRHWPGRTSV